MSVFTKLCLIAVKSLLLATSLTARVTTASTCEYTDVEGTCYGGELKSKYFLLNSTYRNYNHGSFGAVPRPVAEAQFAYYMECESEPDVWMRTTYYEKIVNSRAAIAEVINAESENVVLVENASSAINSILRTIGLKQGDIILRLSTAYGMVISTLNWLVATIGIKVLVVDVTFPITSSQQILDSVKAAYDANPGVVVSIFSHISSVPAVIEPVENLLSLAHSAGSLVIIDGAHAPGAIKIDLKKLQPDFYLGNAHKWLFSPKGTAFLYVKSSLQYSTYPEPSVISTFTLEPPQPLADRYKYTGTRDYTAMSTILFAISFFDTLGGMEKVMQYNHDLACDGATFLAEAWNTSLLVPMSMTGTMSNVILPSSNGDAINYMVSTLLSDYNTFLVAASVVDSQGNIIYYSRLSAQVYLEMEDIKWLAVMVPRLINQYYI